MYTHTHTHMCTHTHIHTLEYYSAIKKNQITFAATSMDLEGIMLSEINQTKKVILYLYVESKYKKLVNITKK